MSDYGEYSRQFARMFFNERARTSNSAAVNPTRPGDHPNDARGRVGREGPPLALPATSQDTESTE